MTTTPWEGRGEALHTPRKTNAFDLSVSSPSWRTEADRSVRASLKAQKLKAANAGGKLMAITPQKGQITVTNAVTGRAEVDRRDGIRRGGI